MERAFGLLHRRIYERGRWGAPSGCCTVAYMKKNLTAACIDEARDYKVTADTPYCTRGGGCAWQ